MVVGIIGKGGGFILLDEDGDGIYEGTVDLEQGMYEYVISATGPADNWSGWGEVVNAPMEVYVIGIQMINGPIMALQLMEILVQLTNPIVGTCNPYCIDEQSGESFLLNPPNNSFARMIHIPFEWNQLPDANSYNFQIVNNYNENMFENSLILDTLINDITFIDTRYLGWNNDYWWRVRPQYNDGSFGEWSTVFSFRVGSKKVY